MNRFERVRHIYSELQQLAGNLAAPGDLLRLAAELVEMTDPVDDDVARFSLQVGGLPFEQWAIDTAMADGGWRVMSYEAEVIRAVFAEDRDVISEQIEREHWLMEHAA